MSVIHDSGLPLAVRLLQFPLIWKSSSVFHYIYDSGIFEEHSYFVEGPSFELACFLND